VCISSGNPSADPKTSINQTTKKTPKHTNIPPLEGVCHHPHIPQTPWRPIFYPRWEDGPQRAPIAHGDPHSKHKRERRGEAEEEEPRGWFHLEHAEEEIHDERGREEEVGKTMGEPHDPGWRHGFCNIFPLERLYMQFSLVFSMQ
jgi:hypothetical protein